MKQKPVFPYPFFHRFMQQPWLTMWTLSVKLSICGHQRAFSLKIWVPVTAHTIGNIKKFSAMPTFALFRPVVLFIFTSGKKRSSNLTERLDSLGRNPSGLQSERPFVEADGRRPYSHTVRCDNIFNRGDSRIACPKQLHHGSLWSFGGRNGVQSRRQS